MSSLVSVASLALILILINHYKIKKTKKNLSFRENLSDKEIYDRFFLDSNLNRSDVSEIWHEIANTLNVSPSKLRPTDEFGKEVGYGLITTEELDTLFWLGRDRAKKIPRKINFLEIRTVDDYVKAFSNQSTAQTPK